MAQALRTGKQVHVLFILFRVEQCWEDSLGVSLSSTRTKCPAMDCSREQFQENVLKKKTNERTGKQVHVLFWQDYWEDSPRFSLSSARTKSSMRTENEHWSTVGTCLVGSRIYFESNHFSFPSNSTFTPVFVVRGRRISKKSMKGQIWGRRRTLMDGRVVFRDKLPRRIKMKCLNNLWLLGVTMGPKFLSISWSQCFNIQSVDDGVEVAGQSNFIDYQKEEGHLDCRTLMNVAPCYRIEAATGAVHARSSKILRWPDVADTSFGSIKGRLAKKARMGNCRVINSLRRHQWRDEKPGNERDINRWLANLATRRRSMSWPNGS